MLNYAPYAKLCSAMLLLCKLCLMLGLCDYAKKQCWHNRAPPTRTRLWGGNCEAMYTSCRDQAPVEYVRGSLLLSTDGLPQWNPSTVHTRYVVQ